MNLFLQGNPNPEGLRAFRAQVESIPNLVEVHDVHFWSLDGVRHVLSLHAVLRDVSEGEKSKEQIRNLSRILGDCHVTIEIESQEEHCHADCEHPHQH
ncbi:MAG: hypothetical protein HC902_09645 [Calothrix sp. SM1_5_4]|nr:hypothetical protein [Calothrix sp. SM1_5_4]